MQLLDKKGLTKFVRIRERRRYGNKTYTWLEIELIGNDGKWYIVGLGDPWPCISPKVSEVNAAIALATAEFYKGSWSDYYLNSNQ